MKKLLLTLTTFIFSLTLFTKPAFAACTVNGEVVPCDVFWSQFGWIFVLMMIFAVVFSVFWIWMLIDCLKRDFKDKVLWILVLIFLQALGSVLYYFIVKQKDSKSVPVQQPATPEPTLPQPGA